jgi:hypothetical protein
MEEDLEEVLFGIDFVAEYDVHRAVLCYLLNLLEELCRFHFFCAACDPLPPGLIVSCF